METKEIVSKMYINFLRKGLTDYAEEFKQACLQLNPGQSLLFDGVLIEAPEVIYNG